MVGDILSPLLGTFCPPFHRYSLGEILTRISNPFSSPNIAARFFQIIVACDKLRADEGEVLNSALSGSRVSVPALARVFSVAMTAVLLSLTRYRAAR